MVRLPKKHEVDEGALALSGQLGKTVQRLRRMYNLSLSELAEQSGVAKSIISQIERNETNPTLATIWRISQALDVSIERVLGTPQEEPFVEKLTKRDIPLIESEDGKCKLYILGWLKTVEWLQIYDFHAEIGGVLDSDAHQTGSIESLSVLRGTLEVDVLGHKEYASAGETLRYRSDTAHCIRSIGDEPAHATMVCILKAAVMD